jgi:activator-of-BECN1-regulated-autophagy protein 1
MSSSEYSPSSVRWHYENLAGLKEEEMQINYKSETPTSEEMQRRFRWRQTVDTDITGKRRVFTPPKFIGNHILGVLRDRSIYGNYQLNNRKLRLFSEYKSVTEYKSAFLTPLGGLDEVDLDGHRPSSSPAVSTISIAFSPCGKTMASTHGDHTVKISDCNSGHLLATLDGHPRTPWTCKYHPTDAKIVASGCLGYQVRVWDWTSQQCLAMIRLKFAIISLSFHPTGKVLAIANGNRLHFLGLDKMSEWSSLSSNSSNADSRGVLEVEQSDTLRCVHFPPSGDNVIVGGVNPADSSSPKNRPRGGGISGGGMSFYLRLWDFDLQAALEGKRGGAQNASIPTAINVRRRVISNVSTVRRSQN